MSQEQGHRPIAQQPGPQPQNRGPDRSAEDGLAYLQSVSCLLVTQQVEFTVYDAENKYKVKNENGDPVFTAGENSDGCERFCCGASRSFNLSIRDLAGREVIYLQRDMAIMLQTMAVYSPPGVAAGYIEQEFGLRPEFLILNAARQPVLRIQGPVVVVSLGQDVVFKIMLPFLNVPRATFNGYVQKWQRNLRHYHILSLDGKHQVGKIRKMWSGLARELFTRADYFGVSFPLDLDVRMKAVMLGALFLIDFMYFERR